MYQKHDGEHGELYGNVFADPMVQQNPLFSRRDMEGLRKEAATLHGTGHVSGATWIEEATVLLLVAVIMLYPVMAGAILSVFTCIHVPGGPSNGYWVRDMTMTCYHGAHMTLTLVLGLPGLLLFVVGPPIWLYLVLRRIRGPKLYEPASSLRYLFLYHSYHHGAYFWEAVRMLYILVLVCVQVLGRRLEGPEHLGVFQAVVIGYLFVVLGLRPHRFGAIVLLETLSYVLVLATSHVIMFGTFQDVTDTGEFSRWFRRSLAACSVFMFVYLLLLLLIIARSFIGKKLSWFGSLRAWPMNEFAAVLHTGQSGSGSH